MPQPLHDSRFLAPDDLAACRALLRHGSRSFHAASLLLPRRVREPATALYAFCRVADDAIDHGTDAPAAAAELRRRLELVYAGRPLSVASDRALAHVVSHYAIPQALPEALIEGLEWDAEGRRYETLRDLEAYAVRVAGTVGTMMTLLMGRRDVATLARACDLGVAMQLTNIARDVGEDVRAGRVYLPLSWLREAGIDADDFVARPHFSPQLATVIARLLDAASILYERADAGIADLPADCRPAIHAAGLVYSEIGRDVARRGFDSVSGRAVVSSTRKLQLLARACVKAVASGKRRDDTILGEAAFLLNAVPQSAPAAAHAIPWWSYRNRLIRVLDLFERLERREQLQRGLSEA